MSCLIPTLKIKELAAQFPNETVRSVTNLISSWQEDYNKSVEEIPSTKELKNYISEIRKPSLENSVSEKTINIFVGANKNEISYQLPQGREQEEFVASEKTVRDLVARMSNFDLFQNVDNSSPFEKLTYSEQQKLTKKIKDISEKQGDRIGIRNYDVYESLIKQNKHNEAQEYKNNSLYLYKIINNKDEKYKGVTRVSDGIIYINLAYATLDTPIHEILGHPIIRAIKNNNNSTLYQNLLEELEYGKGKEVLDRIKRDYNIKDFNIIQNLLGSEIFKDKINALNTELKNIPEFPKIEDFKITKSKVLKSTSDLSINGKSLGYIKQDVRYFYWHRPSGAVIKIGNSSNAHEAFRKVILKTLQKEFNLKYNISEISKKISRYSEKITVVKNAGDTSKGLYYLTNESGDNLGNYSLEELRTIIGEENFPKYTLEEQQEEALVELLGLYTADRLDKVKDGKLISLLKRLLKEMKAFMKQLLGQKEVEIDKLPDNMTLGDIADLLAYSNSKLILPGYEVIYTTQDNQQFKTYAEASNHISNLAKSGEDVDLKSINVNTERTIEDVGEIIEEADEYGPKGVIYRIKLKNGSILGGWYSLDSARSYMNDLLSQNPLKDFIEKNKEYEQAKEIIVKWIRINNIRYNPEEVYSRGQEFVSVLGAYSNFDIDLMMQNLLQHIEDNQKAGGEFTISAFTKPIDKRIGHLEGGGGKIKFKIYPQSQDIKWAANTDVFSGSVWDASEKVSKDKKSELLGVSYTKYPSLLDVHAVQPNLANIIDNLAHHHNELAISLTGSNFRLEYDEDVPYTTKKIIDSINSILDEKYGKIVKPEIKEKENDVNEFIIYSNGFKQGTAFKDKNSSTGWSFKNESGNIKELSKEQIIKYKPKGIQPTQTNETLKESIESVRNELSIAENPYILEDAINELERLKTFFVKASVGAKDFSIVDHFYGYKGTFKTREEAEKALADLISKQQEIIDKYSERKEYTSQALVNTIVAKLKNAPKKYQRSLIRSEVRPINSNSNLGFAKNESPFQKVSNDSFQQSQQELAKDNKDAKYQQLEESSKNSTPVKITDSFIEENLKAKGNQDAAQRWYISQLPEYLDNNLIDEQSIDYAKTLLNIIKNGDLTKNNGYKLNDEFSEIVNKLIPYLRDISNRVLGMETKLILEGTLKSSGGNNESRTLDFLRHLKTQSYNEVRRIIINFAEYTLNPQFSISRQDKEQTIKLLNDFIAKYSTPEKIINIFAGTNENADLSNFANRPFSYDGFTYNSVEQAFQHAKWVRFGIPFGIRNNSGLDKAKQSEIKEAINEQINKIMSAKTGAEAKKLGGDRTIIPTSHSKQLLIDWDSNSSRIMKELIIASFEQNPTALQRLLSTGNAELTHKFRGVEQDGGRFSRLLMEVRNELRDKYQQKTGISPERQQQIEELFKDNPELANAVYSSIGLNMINESEITYTDEEGNPCAKNGMRNSNFTKGSTWKIVQDLKGYPSHAQGGVDIKLGKDGFSFSKNNTIIKAEYGLVLPIN